MGDSPLPGPPGAGTRDERPDSWKEIAAYLGRTTRTVQRWEREAGLPVHRFRRDKQGSVYAVRSELDAWWRSRGEAPESPAGDAAAGPGAPGRAVPRGGGRRLAGIALLAVLGVGAALPLLRRARDPGGGRVRLAVLPFRNAGGDATRDYLADGITEELITELGRSNPSGLGVIARSSVQRYAGIVDAVDRAARDLRVDFVLEGGLVAAGDDLHVTARLVRATDRTVIWAESFDRPLAEMPAIEAGISLEVARALSVPPAVGRATPHQDEEPEAYASFLRGRFEANKRTPEGLGRALEVLTRATEQAPRSARVWSALADTYSLAANYGVLPPDEAYPPAREAADRALALDPELPDAHASLAFILRNYDWDLQGAEREFLAALARNPNDARVWNWYALHLSGGGRFAEAREAVARARDLDPVSPRTLIQAANVEFQAGRYDEAIAALRTILELAPDDANAHLDLGRALAQRGEWDDALAELRRASDLSGGHPMALALIGHVQARAGRTAEARQTLGALLALEPGTYVAPYYKAVLYAGLGDADEAIRWLEVVRESRHVGALFIAVEPELASLRGDPRFLDLLRRLGLGVPTGARRGAAPEVSVAAS
jgi:TolB-like protein/tetratricopeptide (TPR) repeat protein